MSVNKKMEQLIDNIAHLTDGRYNESLDINVENVKALVKDYINIYIEEIKDYLFSVENEIFIKILKEKYEH